MSTFLSLGLPIIIVVAVVLILMAIIIIVIRRKYHSNGADVELTNSPNHINPNPVVVLLPIVPQHLLTPSQTSLVRAPEPFRTQPMMGYQAGRDLLRQKFDRFDAINEQARAASKNVRGGHKGDWVETHEGKYIGARVNLKSKVDMRGGGVQLQLLKKESGSSGQSSEHGEDEINGRNLEPWTNVAI